MQPVSDETCLKSCISPVDDQRSFCKNSSVSGDTVQAVLSTQAAALNGYTRGSTPLPYCNNFLNLEVKVLTQALGAENQWQERGDGRVEFIDCTIRVMGKVMKDSWRTTSQMSPLLSDLHTDECEPNGVAAIGGNGNLKGNGGHSNSALQDSPDNDFVYEEVVVLEDTITSDTPFVGENCCIVWNSFEQQLSLCLMYAFEEGYSASWSALVSLQDKSYPPLHFDVLARCKPSGVNMSSISSSPTGDLGASSGDAISPGDVVPYSFFIHDKYSPPLGFIEQHALSLSIIENNHFNKELFADAATALVLLKIGNQDLIEHMLSEEVFPLLLQGLGCQVEPDLWTMPAGLSALDMPGKLAELVSQEAALSFLQAVGLPSHTDDEIYVKLISISHRLRNEFACAILSSDDILLRAKDALLVAPPPTSVHSQTKIRGGPLERVPSCGSLHSDCRGNSMISTSGSYAPPTTDGHWSKEEQQVFAHLRFFRSVVAMSIAELGRELVGPVIIKVLQCGLLEALAVVAERYALPSGVAATFLHSLQEGDRAVGRMRSSHTTSNHVAQASYYAPAFERELAALLDATVVRLNERQEEQLLNDYFRSPILADPIRYNGFMTFMLRQVVMSGDLYHSLNSRYIRDFNGCKNSMLLYHLLGLHDDEGSAAAERALYPESAEVRSQFQHFVITKYLALAMRGALAPVPPPPGLVYKSMTIVKFNNSDCSTLSPALKGISSALITLLQYLIVLVTPANRDVLLKVIFHSKSRVLPFVIWCCEMASAQHCIGMDLLSANIRFLKAVVSHMIPQRGSEPLETCASFALLSQELLPKRTVTMICRMMTVECDVFGPILKAYNELGGVRRNSVFHSSVLSLLEYIVKHHSCRSDPEEVGCSNLRDVRDYLFFKYLSILPSRYVQRCRDIYLDEVVLRLGRDETSSVNNSISVLSSTLGSETMRSTTKIRIVDELDAAANGVDSILSPGGPVSLSLAGEDGCAGLPKKLRTAIDRWPVAQPYVHIAGNSPSSSDIHHIVVPRMPSLQSPAEVFHGTSSGSRALEENSLQCRETPERTPTSPSRTCLEGLVGSIHNGNKPVDQHDGSGQTTGQGEARSLPSKPNRPATSKNEKVQGRPTSKRIDAELSRAAESGSSSTSKSRGTSLGTGAGGSTANSGHHVLLPRIAKQLGKIQK